MQLSLHNEVKRILLFLLITCTCGVNLLHGQRKQGQARIDSLLEELPNAKEDTNKVKLLAGLCYDYFSIDPDQGIRYGKEGLALAEKLQWKTGVTLVNGNIGINYAVRSEYASAREYFLKALEGYTESGNKRRIALVLGNIGNIYAAQADYPRALEYHIRALAMNEEVGSKAGIGINLGNIGLVYKNLDDYPLALEYFSRALKTNEELGNKNNMANNLASIGIVYYMQLDYQPALDNYFKALGLYEEIGAKDGMAKSLSYIGNVYANQLDYPRAIEYLFKSLEIYKEMGNKIGMGSSLGNIGRVYLYIAKDSNNHHQLDKLFGGNKMTALQQAKLYVDSAIVIENESGILNNLAESYRILGEIQSLLGDYKGAYDAHKLYKELSDSTFNIEKDKKITTVVKY